MARIPTTNTVFQHLKQHYASIQVHGLSRLNGIFGQWTHRHRKNNFPKHFLQQPMHERQTSTVIASWKENLEQIESAHNAEAWQRIMDDVNKAGGKKSMKHE